MKGSEEVIDEEKLKTACAFIDAVLKKAKRAYIGRSNFPERRLLEHMAESRRNKLLSVYWADSKAEAKAAEEALIKKYGSRLKLENKASDARGRWGLPPHAVYVSWVWSTGNAQVTPIRRLTAKLVNELPAEPGRSRYLRTELSAWEAEQVL